MKKKLVLSLGSNLGNRYAYIRQANAHIRIAFETETTEASYYTTPPWGNEDQASFINTVILFETKIPVEECLIKLQSIEKKMGRVKTEKWGPRIIDIDILFYGETVTDSKSLTVPHPYLHTRAFVMVPLSDILPDMIHPILNLSNSVLSHSIQNDTTLFHPQLSQK